MKGDLAQLSQLSRTPLGQMPPLNYTKWGKQELQLSLPLLTAGKSKAAAHGGVFTAGTERNLQNEAYIQKTVQGVVLPPFPDPSAGTHSSSSGSSARGPSWDETPCSLPKPNQALDNTFLWLSILL